jgi:hypothetical protein
MNVSISAITKINWQSLPYDTSVRTIEAKYGLDSPLAYAAWLMLKTGEQITFSKWKAAFKLVRVTVLVSNDSAIIPLPALETIYLNDENTLALIDGDINDWRIVIPNAMQKRNKHVRILADYCFLLFEQYGLGHVFLDYEKVANEDQTFFLRLKNGS